MSYHKKDTFSPERDSLIYKSMDLIVERIKWHDHNYCTIAKGEFPTGFIN